VFGWLVNHVGCEPKKRRNLFYCCFYFKNSFFLLLFFAAVFHLPSLSTSYFVLTSSAEFLGGSFLLSSPTFVSWFSPAPPLTLRTPYLPSSTPHIVQPGFSTHTLPPLW
jgi:hypothetical protein